MKTCRSFWTTDSPTRTVLTRMTFSCYNICVEKPYDRRKSTKYCGFGPLMDVDKLIRATANMKCRSSFGPLMDVDKLIPTSSIPPAFFSFGPLMDVDKLILLHDSLHARYRFGPLMDVDKRILGFAFNCWSNCFGPLMDVDKLIPSGGILNLTRLFWASDGC